jgi:hypothetical protein
MAKYRLLFGDATSVQEDDCPKWEDQLDDQGEARLKEIVASRFCFPPSDVHIESWDGDWMDFLVWFSFEANSLGEIRSEVERIIQTCGRDVEVFSVLDEADNAVLTEEEFWDPAVPETPTRS